MEVDTAADFLVGSILFGLGFCILAVVIVFINNVFHKYWKPVKILSLPASFTEQSNTRFATAEEMTRITPTLHQEDGKPLDLSTKR